ncbi:MAG: hypothetical protein N2200_09125 [Bacteroidia bacterium]|nr:hypothetical protein [Bacteroidia bacterium]MDW8416146.1 hypothetical protein [Bacteroidia bacterium]
MTSPVAYIPIKAYDQGYKVVQELSHGWKEAQVPLFLEGPWQISQIVHVPYDSTVLYIEGAVGKISVYQDMRLLWRGDTENAWIPILGRGSMRLTIKGERGGIVGGVYLLVRSDTQAWQREVSPPFLPLCERSVLKLTPAEALSASPLQQGRNACLAYPFPPPGRIRSVMHARQHKLSAFIEAPQFEIKPYFLYRTGFVLIWAVLAGMFAYFPALRQAFWQGWLKAVSTDPVETILGLVWVGMGAGMSLWSVGKESWLWIFLLTLATESVFFGWFFGKVHWVWQSWLLPIGIVSIVTLLYPHLFTPVGIGVWVIRSLRFSLHSLKFIYLCSAEMFMLLLNIPLSA